MLEELLSIDKEIFIYLNNLGTETWDGFWLFITNKYTMIGFYVLMMYFMYKKFGKKFWIPLLFTILCAALSDRISVDLFKEVFKRLRPTHDPSMDGLFRALQGKGGPYTFVSSHATNVFAMSFWLYHLLKKDFPFLKWLFLGATIVAYSRIYVGKHYPLDLIGGALLGLIIGKMVLELFRFLSKKWFGNYLLK
ncbi:MAG: phosphatase PAP2 family protein [Flavobacteriales bacterium]|jgi:undecaprenyl-diphosphatase|nr:phosphatase PAP2 family protein [Flavobacteriales bacterium]